MPHRRAVLERLEGVDRRVVSRHPLDSEEERLFIGRSRDAWVRLQHPAVARKHVMLDFGPLGRWWLNDMGSTNGVWVNRTHYGSGRRVLEPNDIIRFGGGDHDDIVFRFNVEGWTDRDAAMRAAIDEAPEDDARWQVWADFLEEQGDPLSERIRGHGPSPGDLGVSTGHAWEHGFIARGNLHRGGRILAFLSRELEVLLGNPFSRWMRTLHVDVGSYLDGSPHAVPANEGAEAVRVLETLALERPPTLSVLTMKLATPADGRLKTAFGRLKLALPKLQSDYEALVQR